MANRTIAYYQKEIVTFTDEQINDSEALCTFSFSATEKDRLLKEDTEFTYSGRLSKGHGEYPWQVGRRSGRLEVSRAGKSFITCYTAKEDETTALTIGFFRKQLKGFFAVKEFPPPSDFLY